MVAPVARWLNPSGIQRDSSLDTIQLMVAARCKGGISFVRFTVNGVDTDVSTTTLTRGTEQASATDPVDGCGAGEQAPCRVYALSLDMATMAAGAITVAATVYAPEGTRTLPTQTHWNNKSGALVRQVIHLNEASGNDSNNGLTSGASKKTMRAALAAGYAITSNLGLVDIHLHGTCKWNDIAGTAFAPTTTAHQWCRIIGIDGTPEIVKDGDWENRPRFAVGAGNTIRFWFQNLTWRGKLRTTLDSGSIAVALDHCTVKPSSPWDGASDPYAGAYDEGQHSLFWLSTGEPAETWALGCDVSGMPQPFADKQTVLRGCLIHKGYGVMLQLAGGQTLDSVTSDVAVVSCEVTDWRHSTDGVRGAMASAITTTHLEGVDNGAGSLRVREDAGGSVAAYATNVGYLAGSTTIGLSVKGLTALVLGSGTDGSGRQYVDVDLDASTYAFPSGSSTTIFTARMIDGAEWSTFNHGDLVKLNSPTVARNFIWLDNHGTDNSTPRGFGLDSHLQDVWISCANGLSHPTVRNDGVGAAGHTYNHVLIENYSADGSLNLWSANSAFQCEVRDCVMAGLNPGSGGTLAQLEASWAFVSNHFVDSADAIGTNATTGTAFLDADPGTSGDYRLDPGSSANGTASNAAGRPSQWFIGNRGVLHPGEQGSWDIPSPSATAFSLDACTLTLDTRNLAPRGGAMHTAEWALVTPVWPPGFLDSGTATAATGTTLTDATKAWTTDQWKGMWVLVPALGVRRNIKSNTATALTLDDHETFPAGTVTALAAGASYELGPTGPAVSLQLVDSPFGLTNPHTGAVEQVPDVFPYAPATAAQEDEASLDEVEVIATYDANTELRITFSRRAAMVTHVRMVMQDSGRTYDRELMKRDAQYGLGSSFSQATLAEMFRSDPDDGVINNPTHGGSTLLPSLAIGANGYAAPLVRIIPSPPVSGGTFYASGGPGVARTRGCSTPLEWDASGYGGNGPLYTKGGTNDIYAAYVRQRESEHTDWFIGGRKYIHRIGHWSYDPAPYDAARYGAAGEFVYSIGQGLPVPNRFDEAYIVDPITGVATAIDSTLWQAGIGDQWQLFPKSFDLLRHIEYLGSTIDEPTPLSGEYGAIILRDTTDDFTVGVITKMRTLNASHLDRTAVPTWIVLSQSRNSAPNPALPEYDQPNWVGFQITSSAPEAPPQGWMGTEFYTFYGPFDRAIEAIQEAYSSGLLDEEADVSAFLDIPTVVEGTELELPVIGATFDLDAANVSLAGAQIDVVGGAAFIVEDGTVVDGANSYASVDDANTYFAALSNPAAWTSATTETKQQALRVATDWLDTTFRQQWTGVRIDATQPLDHPQLGSIDPWNFPVVVPPLPPKLIAACCEAALLEVQTPGILFGQSTTTGASTSGSTSLTIGGFSVRSASGISAGTTQALISKVIRLLQAGGLIETGGWAKR